MQLPPLIKNTLELKSIEKSRKKGYIIKVGTRKKTTSHSYSQIKNEFGKRNETKVVFCGWETCVRINMEKKGNMYHRLLRIISIKTELPKRPFCGIMFM